MSESVDVVAASTIERNETQFHCASRKDHEQEVTCYNRGSEAMC